MRILLDECPPRRLREDLPEHDVRTVADAGWQGRKNGELLALAAGNFDVFLTKAMLDDFKAQGDALLKQAEAKYAELKKSADANGDGIPDALEAAMAQARLLVLGGLRRLSSARCSWRGRERGPSPSCD